MFRRIATLLLLFILVISHVNAQFSFKIQSGISFIEHISTGISLGLGKNDLSLIYGSNFFIRRGDFSSYMIGYDRYFNKFKFKGFIPKTGIKGGYSIYTNKYYRWKLLVLIPDIGVEYPISKRAEISFDVGIAISEERSLERINYGEIGTYRKRLPEFKLSLFYNLSRL
jgi:hypothetical protein